MGEDEFCPMCGSEKDWVDCFDCGGDGDINVYDGDLLEDTYETCMTCDGHGGWYVCPNVPHTNQGPVPGEISQVPA